MRKLFIILGAIAFIFPLAFFMSAPLMNYLRGAGDTSPRSDAPSDDSAQPLPDEAQLRQKVEGVLSLNERRYLDASQHAAWQIMHEILGYGHRAKIYDEGKLVDAVPWLLAGGRVQGFTLRPADHGLDTLMEPGTKTGQGHEDQWLAVLSQCGLSPETTIVWDGKDYRMIDLVTQAQWDVHQGMECSWTLIGLTAYLPLDSEWTARDGETWTIERIVAMEADQDINASACGGTHRLIGMTMALNHHLADGGQLTGGWQAADECIQEHIVKARVNQQPDGAFSAEYFRRPASSPEIEKRIGTTGHTLEFLTLAMTDEELREPWVTRAAVHLCNLLEQTNELPVECGALYHAIHGLQIYHQRRWGDESTNPYIAPQAPAATQVKSTEPAPAPPMVEN